jgi:hypothetical protein
MSASQRPPGAGSWARAQRVPPEFKPTMGWALERSGGRWWRWPAALLTLVAAVFVGFLIMSFIASIARRAGTDEGPLAVLVWVGLAFWLAIGIWGGLTVARPPLRWVPRERLMAVKSDQQRRLEAGAEGEFITGGFLRPLEAEGYVARHSIEVPGEQRPIDHIVVGPTGLFVVESKYYVEDVHAINGRLFGDGTPLDKQVALLRHQADLVWRRVGAPAGVSVRAVFSMVGNQTTPPFALDHALWCVPGRDLAAVIRSWHPRRLEPELVRWLAEQVDRAFIPGNPVPAPTPAPRHTVLEGTTCDRDGCEGTRELREGQAGPYLACTSTGDGGCDRYWTLDGWPLAHAPE